MPTSASEHIEVVGSEPATLTARACSFDAFDIRREIKITLETDATKDELHLVHSEQLGVEEAAHLVRSDNP